MLLADVVEWLRQSTHGKGALELQREKCVIATHPKQESKLGGSMLKSNTVLFKQ